MLKADYYYESIYTMDFGQIRDESIRHLLIDFDNTLVKHGSISLDERATKLLEGLETLGFDYYIFSNAKSKRLQKIIEISKLPYIKSPQKPLPFAINAFVKAKGLSKSEVAVIGDQVFTDLLAGKMAGVKTILVNPLYKEEPGQIKFKRFLEGPFRKNTDNNL